MNGFGEQLILLIVIIAGSMLAVALGIIVAKRFRRALPDDTLVVDLVDPRVVAVDPRPLPESPSALSPDDGHRGEVWLSLGSLPVNARQFALIMAKLPIGTQFVGIEPDPVNGESAVKAGFTHYAFAAADAVKYPNGPRLWVSWANDNEPVISWPLVDD